MGARDEVGELRQQVAALLDRVTDLEARLDADRTGEPSPVSDAALTLVPTDPADRSRAEASAEHPAGSSRRQLLKAVGVAAAGAVGTTVALAGTAGSAAAADGANIQVGESHTGTGANSLTDLSNSSFRVTGGPTSALYGIQSKTNTPAITGYGQGVGGDGIRGFASDTGAGVSAESAKGHGMETKTTAAGKAAISAEATAAGATAVLAKSSSGPAIQILQGPTTMPPFTGTWAAGSLAMNNGHLWYCYVGGVGEASKWTRLSGTFFPLAGSKRVYDSRPGTLPAVGTKTRFDNSTTRVIDAKTGGAILPGASAVLLNVVATETNPAGYFSFWRNGIAWPGTSSINWNRPDTTIANSVVTSLDANGFFQARMEGAGGAHLVVDVVGFYL